MYVFIYLYIYILTLLIALTYKPSFFQLHPGYIPISSSFQIPSNQTSAAAGGCQAEGAGRGYSRQSRGQRMRFKEESDMIEASKKWRFEGLCSSIS